MYVGQWPIFHGPVILPYILRTSWWTVVIIGILVPCDAKIYHIKCKSVTYISWSSDFVLYLEDYLMDECCTGDIDSVWHKHSPWIIYVGQWPIFHGLVIWLYILKSIWWTNVIIGIMDPCDAKIYYTKCLAHSFVETWSWKHFYCYSPSSAISRRAVVSYWQKNVH